MGKIDNDFDERLKKYSEEIKKMEVVYHDGRVKCINKKDRINIKNLSTIEKSYCADDDNRCNNYSIVKDTFIMLGKLMMTSIIMIGIPFSVDKIISMGVNGFISGVATICIAYFLINFIWVFLD